MLVDRLWPRGIKKEDAHLDLWLKDIAPSTDLRKWFGHDIEKWDDFQQKFKKELESNQALQQLRDIIKNHKKVTLIYATKDELHNNAVVIKEVLEP